MSKLQELDNKYVANTYARFPVEIVSGKGSIAKDTDGKEYIDMGSGIGVTSFGIADDVLKQAVTSISELVGYSENVMINQDFADVSAIMRDAGRAHMGVGIASGKEKAEAAANAAVTSPLLETSIDGATGVLINVTGSPEMELEDVETAASIVQRNAMSATAFIAVRQSVI